MLKSVKMVVLVGMCRQQTSRNLGNFTDKNTRSLRRGMIGKMALIKTSEETV